MITHIFHVSDIHIFEKNYTNIRSSWLILVKTIVAWPNYRTTTLLVITGDVFEFKTYLNSDDVHLFYEMMSALEANHIRTIIIPGNHDYNINSKCAQDNISILLGTSAESNAPAWKYITCYSKSGVYMEQQIAFHVFSPIDKIIPTRQSNKYVNVALLHEPIIAAQFDNNENIHNGRFRLDELAPQYDMVLLGDIHKPQFLAANTAYAGSFVQKNRGEGLNHGYILWDVAAKTGSHFWIPLKEVAVKIVAKDNQFVAPLPEIKAVINYLALIYQNCSADWIQIAANEIRDKYHRPISQIIRHEPNRKLKIDVPNSLQMDMSKFTHTNMITQILQESKTDDAMIRRVLDYHNKFLQNRQLYPTVRYYLRYLAWSNVFCYGPNNYINFEELQGLVALSGRNKIGKSSVIDILIRILFNECERGHKDDIINKHAKSAYIKCCFRILNDEYIVEQSWQKYSTATTYHLYKNGQDITKDTLVKTYKYIREDLGLGNYKDFVNLTTAMQNRQFIVDLDKKDMYSLLCKLLDIDTMRDIEEHVKKERDFLRRDKKTKLKELNELGTEENSEDAWNKEIGTIAEIIASKNKTKSELSEQLDACRTRICTLHRQIQHIDLPQDWEPHEINPTQPDSATFSLQEYSEIKSKIDSLKITFGIHKEQLVQFDKSKIKTIKAEIDSSNYVDLLTYLQNGTVANEELRSDISNSDLSQIILNASSMVVSKLEADSKLALHTILPFKTNLSYQELIAVPKEHDCELDALYRQLKNRNPNISLDDLANSELTPIESFQELEEKAKECRSAQKYLAIYKAKRNVVQEIINHMADMSAASQNYDSVNEYLSGLLQEYQEQYANAKLASKFDIAKIESQIEFLREKDIVEHNSKIEAQINSKKLYLDAVHDIGQHDRIKANIKIEAARQLYQQYLDLKYYYEYIAIRQTLMELKEQIDAMKIEIVEYEEAECLRKEAAEYEQNLCKYNQRVANQSYEEEIYECEQREQHVANQLAKINSEIAEHERAVQTIQNLKVRYGDIKNKIVELDDTLNLYEAYYSCINHKTGIPSTILKQVCVVLSDQCNQILCNITDFNVEFLFDEDIKIFTIAKGIDNVNMRLSASLGSGFQKFLLDMIMRIVLTRISNISNPNILFVDEGFGCLDKENFSNVCSCLMKLKNNFDSMIVITHIPELQSYMDQTMTVYQEDCQSGLQFGQLTIDEYDLFENANLRIIKRSIETKVDPNPEIIIRPTDNIVPEVLVAMPVIPIIAQPITPSNQEQNENVWVQHIPSLSTKFNVDASTLMDEIFGRLIPYSDDKYNCICCNKSFKKIEQARNHLNTKTYKAKHLKFLIN